MFSYRILTISSEFTIEKYILLYLPLFYYLYSAGAGRSGTFVACFNMCEQMRNEYAVDVFNVVQRLRNVRPQLVETLVNLNNIF